MSISSQPMTPHSSQVLNMRKGIILIAVSLFFGQLVIAQKFSPDSVRQTIDHVTGELMLKHPGFYRYTSKKEFGIYIDSVKSTIREPLTEYESYLKLKAIIAKIHCLHTTLSLPGYYTDSVNKLPVLFPFQIYFVNDKAYITKNRSDIKSIVAGDELVSINGQGISSIVARILPFISSDGYNVTMKYRVLYYQFPLLYRIIEQQNQFVIVIKRHDKEETYQVKGALWNDIAEEGFLKEPLRLKQLEFNMEHDIGFLKIHSFAKSDIEHARQDFKKFIDLVFAQLQENKIKDLVVDLRDNTGGSDNYAAYFTSFFFEKPFRYWDRIEVTDAIAKQIKGLVLLSYRKPVKRDSVWLWQKAKKTDEFDFYEEQQPAENNYKGNTYVLINGFCMSSCADVAAVLSFNKKATFIGEETGGGYQGNNSGMLPETKIPLFNFILTVPLQKYYNAVNPSENPGRGTIPDYRVVPSVSDVISGADKPLDFTIQLINKK
jgi:hypothetical protein